MTSDDPSDTGAWGFALLPVCRPPLSDQGAVIAALRAALMSRARSANGHVPTLFSGHPDHDSGPARSGQHRHIFLAALDRDGDGRIDWLEIFAPWRQDISVPASAADQERFDHVTSGLRQIRAGAVGLIELAPPHRLPPLFGQIWHTLTPYHPPRHPDPGPAAARQIAEGAAREIHRRGWPRPTRIAPTLRWGRRGGVTAHLRLFFPAPIPGPLLLGRDAHRGGGYLIPAPDPLATAQDIDMDDSFINIGQWE